MQSLLFLILATLSISANAASSRIEPTTKLKNLRANYFLAGNLLGPQGVGNDVVKMVKPITLAPNRDSAQSGTCTFSIPMDEKFHEETLVIDHAYGVVKVEEVENVYDHHKTAFIQLSNVYRTPTNLWISCDGITTENTIQDVETAAQGAVKFKRLFF